jgi:TonB family protein
MSMLKTIVPKSVRPLTSQFFGKLPADRRQRGLMIGSLCLLIVSLGIVLWHNRDFWFGDSDSSEAEIDQTVENPPAAKIPIAGQPATLQPEPSQATGIQPATATLHIAAKPSHKSVHGALRRRVETAVVAQSPETMPGIVATNRTALPPLDVEVVAGDTHRVIRPGSNSLHVDLQPEDSQQASSVMPEVQSAATVTSEAAERVEVSSDTANLVTEPVKPAYPMLARQMKVQGSVILQALIGRDGVIQNLQVISGPRILASAAEDAVRQWHFRPHIEGKEAVETQAKITVNFTISTN